MATARERLLQALTAIVSQPFDHEGETALKRLLKSYRIQAKPEENVDKNQTARDELANRIINTWKAKTSFDRKTISKLFSPFRMQLKQGLKNAKLRQQKNVEASDTKSPNINDSFELSRKQIKENILKHENAYFRDKEKNNQNKDHYIPIAGGPQKKSNTRGQCPKCRSMGIVLAPSYSGNDHYSCIYCGYHAFLDTKDPELDLPLAAEILGKFFNDKDQEE